MNLGEGKFGVSDYQWIIRGQNLFIVVDGEEIPAKSFGIIANGTQDLYLIKHGASHILTTNTQTPENIIWKPDGDLFVVIFHEPLPQSQGGRQVLYLEVKGMEPLVEELMRRMKGKRTHKGNQYDAYLGKEYE